MSQAVKYKLFVILFYFFIFQDALEECIYVIKYTDEIIAVTALVFIFMDFLKDDLKFKIYKMGFAKYIVILSGLGLISTFVYQYQPFFTSVLPDMFLNLKFWLTIYLGEKILYKFDYNLFALNILGHIKFVLVLFTSSYCFDCIFNVFESGTRYGINVAKLFYSHSTFFANACAVIVFVLILIRGKISRFELYFFWACTLMCLSLRSKAIGAVTFFVIAYVMIFVLKKKFTLKSLVAFIPVIIAVAWEQIDYYFISRIGGNNPNARTQLLVKSVSIANDHFPLGAGYATYNSYFSQYPYSSLYYTYDLSTIYGLTEKNSAFVSDSFWPMIIGQFGWVGLILFALALLFLFIKIEKLRKIDMNLFFVGLCIFVYLGIYSTSGAAYVSPISIPMAILLGNIFSYI